MTYEISHDNILRRDEINEFLSYVDSLEETAQDTDLHEDERAEARAELDDIDMERVKELRNMVEYGDGDFISDDYWKDYAAEFADELMYGSSEFMRNYFDYSQWASDLQLEYTGWSYDGRTYYSHD